MASYNIICHTPTMFNWILMGVKSKVSLWYQICSLGTKPNIPSQIYWTKFTKPNLQNWIYKIKSTNQNVFNAKNQIYQTKPIQSNLQNKINPIITIKPNLYNPNIQTVKVKSNSSLSWAWPSSVPALPVPATCRSCLYNKPYNFFPVIKRVENFLVSLMMVKINNDLF